MTMKKKLIISSVAVLLALIVAFLFIFVFTSEDFSDKIKTVTIQVVDAKKEVVLNKSFTTTARTLEDLLVLKKSQIKAEITADGMVSAIFDIKPDAAKQEWIGIYTSLTNEKYTNATWGVYKADGKEYGSAAVGIKLLPLIAGQTYVFVVNVGW